MEHVRRPVVDGVRLAVASDGSSLEGSLCISAFFLIYSTRRQAADEINVLHTSIDHLDHKSGSSSTVLHLKDFRRLQFEFGSPEECQDVVDALEIFSKPVRLNQLYVFSYSPRTPLPPCPWRFASAQELLARWQCSEKHWRVSTLNRNFLVCPSYPQELLVPQTISDEELIKSVSFRHFCRFPILCFHHKKNKAVLMRCSQPLCGPAHKRCREDEKLLNACLHSLTRGKILDVRPQATAQMHMSKGGGIELPAHYPQWKVEFGKMDTPSTILASLVKLIEACADSSLASSSSWFARLEGSGWPLHLTRLLQAARFVTLCIHKDASSVVVHGSGGRDATLQVTALAQLLMEAHCRTVEGFVELVQREWLDGGHPFSLRHTHVTSAPEKERAPMFLLFLDAVWQVMQQYPLSFEFNELFLHSLFTHSYYSCYGNFLYDTPQERHKNKLFEKTQSLWAYLAQPDVLEKMLNPLYEKNSSVLILSVHALNVTLWKRLYLCTDVSPAVSLPEHASQRELKDINTALKKTLAEARQELMELQTVGRRFVSNWS